MAQTKESVMKMEMTESQFEEFLNYCYEMLEKKQALLHREFGIGDYEEYWYNQEDSKLRFKNNGEIQLEFSVVFIGSWSSRSNTWMWAWANTSMTDEVKERSYVLRELTSFTGYDLFSKEYFECDETMAHELTAFSVEHLQAIGMYISPNDKSNLFIALMNPIN